MNISIVMGVYNGEDYLAEAIISILSQSLTNFEFIIVDDGSVDKTSKIISYYLKKDSRVKCISLKRNRGLANALNVGIRASSGKFIVRMDCDDISLPDRLKKQFYIMENSNIDILGSNFISINSVGRSIKSSSLPLSDDEIKYQLPYENCINHSTVMMKKSSLETIGFYNNEYINSQDYDLWLRSLTKLQFANIPEPLVKYRKHQKRISHKKNSFFQTHFSVCAALNYFQNKYGFKVISPSETVSSIINGFEEICFLEVSSRDQYCINRHMIRLGRECNLNKIENRVLDTLILRSTSVKEKLKWVFYKLISK